MNNYLSYIRVSTPRQGEQSVSLPEQRDFIERYARESHLPISTWFEDRETAAKQGRPAFAQMLHALDKQKAAGVIFYKVDRSSRNSSDWADVDQLVDRGFEVHFAHDRLVLSKRGDRLTANIYAVLAADYIRNLREEVKKGFYGRLKQGLWPMPAPLGYLNNGSGKPKTIDPLQGPLVRQAFELYASGRFSIRSLNEEMWRRGMRSRRGDRLRFTTLTDMLHNPFYIGLIQIKDQTYRGVHEPLITTQLFEAVQSASGRAPVHQPLVHDLLFRQMLKCAHCQYSLIGEKQKQFIYYRCHTRDCPTTSIREDVVEAHLRSLLAPLQTSPIPRDELVAAIADEREHAETERNEQRKAQQLRLTAIDERLKRLTDAYLEGAVERTDLEQRKTALLMERRRLEDALNVDQDKEKPDEMLEGFLELASRADLLYETALPDEKRELVEIFTSNRAVDGRTPCFTLRSPFSELAAEGLVHYGGPRRRPARTRSIARRIASAMLRFVASSQAPSLYQRVKALDQAARLLRAA